MGAIVAPGRQFDFHARDLIAPPTTEDKHMARKRVLLQRLLGLRRQRREPATHVRHTGRKPNPCVCWARIMLIDLGSDGPKPRDRNHR